MRVPGFAASFRQAPLDAWLAEPLAAPASTYSQREFADLVDTSVQSLRDWHRRGLPLAPGSGRQPRYDARALWWVIIWHRRQRRGLQAPRHLSAAEVEREWLADQAQADPEGWVLVPLTWSHPLRGELLARAAAGRRPAPMRVEREATGDDTHDDADGWEDA